MAWVEVVSKRNKKEKHYYDADAGKYQAVLTIHDQHYKDDADTWQDVDENFVDDTGGFDKKCDKTRHIFKIASGGNRRWYPRRNVLTEYVDITGIQYYDNQWRNLNLPTPVWTNNKSEWDMTDLYASITNTWKRIKTDFTLKNSNAFTRLRFAVSFTGLTYNDTTGELTSTTDGLVWGYIDKPNAHYGTFPNEVDVPVTQVYSSGYIEWSVDTTGASFPIYIDPTFTDGYGGDVETYNDTYLKATDADSNFGTEYNIYVDSATYRGIIKFDCSSIPSSASCDSATLYVYHSMAGVGTVEFHELLSGNSSYTESGATWNHQTGTTDWAGSGGCSTSGTDFDATALGTYSHDSSEGGHEYVVGLTALSVKDWFGASNANYGMVIYKDGTSMGVSSSDQLSGVRPKLVVVYTSTGGTTLEVNNMGGAGDIIIT